VVGCLHRVRVPWAGKTVGKRVLFDGCAVYKRKHQANQRTLAQLPLQTRRRMLSNSNNKPQFARRPLPTTPVPLAGGIHYGEPTQRNLLSPQ
jgi:hypothetical protein